MAFKVTYGYRIKDGNLIVNSEERKIIKLVFNQYLKKHNKAGIVRYLNENNYRYQTGGKWYFHLITKMLKNGRYKGDNNYPKIIDPKIFDEVQSILNKSYENNIKENQLVNKDQSRNKYTNKIICGNCGSKYIRITRVGIRDTWVCKNSESDDCDCKFLFEKELDSLTDNLLRTIKRKPNLVHTKKNKVRIKVDEKSLEKDLDEFEDYLSKLISSHLYILSKADKSEELIEYIKRNAYEIDSMDLWFNKIVNHIVVNNDGSISYVLVNDKVITYTYQLKEEK